MVFRTLIYLASKVEAKVPMSVQIRRMWYRPPSWVWQQHSRGGLQLISKWNATHPPGAEVSWGIVCTRLCTYADDDDDMSFAAASVFNS